MTRLYQNHNKQTNIPYLDGVCNTLLHEGWFMHSPALNLQRPNSTALVKLFVLAQLRIRYKKILTDIRAISVHIHLLRHLIQASHFCTGGTTVK